MSGAEEPYLEKRLFEDHLAYQFEQGSVDFSTMVMEVPRGDSAVSHLVRAHETIHVTLTYSTTLGIFLDLLATLSTVKLMNILRESPALDIPLFSTIDQKSPLYGQILFAFIVEKALFYGTEVWRPLQEAVATYMMLEEAPRIVKSATLYKNQDMKKAVSHLRERIKQKELYHKGYVTMKEVSRKLGHNQVYAACFLASDLPFYARMFVPGKYENIRGDILYRELQTCAALLRNEFNPSSRLQWIADNVDKESLKEDLNSFTPFVVPTLFPHTDWQERNSRWIKHVASFLGGNPPEGFSSQAAAGFRVVAEQGRPPVVMERNEISFMNDQEFGILKYILGSLKAACYYGKSQYVILPEHWKELSASSLIEDAQKFVKKHQLPLVFKPGT
jgi:hypothetical protein